MAVSYFWDHYGHLKCLTGALILQFFVFSITSPALLSLYILNNTFSVLCGLITFSNGQDPFAEDKRARNISRTLLDTMKLYVPFDNAMGLERLTVKAYVFGDRDYFYWIKHLFTSSILHFLTDGGRGGMV